MEIDGVGDQSAAKEDPLNGAERSSGFVRIRWAIATDITPAVEPIRYSSDLSEPSPGPKP